MAKPEVYYWIDSASNFGAGDDAIQCGEKMPEKFLKDARFESFKKEGKISTEKVASKRQLSELESLREQVANSKSGKCKNCSDLEVKIADLESQSGSAQSDLDTIQELEEELDLIKETLSNIQQTDKKEELWDAVKSIKDLFKES